jgi:hypothetical protein
LRDKQPRADRDPRRSSREIHPGAEASIEAPQRPAAALALQQSAGNRATAHLLRSPDLDERGQEGTVARNGAPTSASAPTTETSGGGGASQDPLAAAIREAVRGVLGTDRIHELVDGATDAAAAYLQEQLPSILPRDQFPLLDREGIDARFATAGLNEALPRILNDWVDERVREVLESPEGQRLRQRIIDLAGDEPAVVLAAAIIGGVAAYYANAPIPELARKFKLGGGASLEAGAQVGRAQQLAVERIRLAFGYSHRAASARLSGRYSPGEERPAGAAAEVRVGSRQGPNVSVNGDAEIGDRDNLRVNLGGAVSLGPAGASIGATHTRTSDEEGGAVSGTWSGNVQVRFGREGGPAVTTARAAISPDGEVSIDLRNALRIGALRATTTAGVRGGDVTYGAELSARHRFDLGTFDARLQVEGTTAGPGPTVTGRIGYESRPRGGAPQVRIELSGGVRQREIPGATTTGGGSARVQEIHVLGTLGLRF